MQMSLLQNSIERGRLGQGEAGDGEPGEGYLCVLGSLWEGLEESLGCEQGGWDGALGTEKDGKEKVVEEKKNAFGEQSSRAKKFSL